MLIASLAALVLGVRGVSSSRDMGACYASVQIPQSWYWFAVLPPVIIATLAILLPQRVICWRRGFVASLLGLVSMISGGASPLLYIIYDFEHRLPNQPASQRTTP